MAANNNNNFEQQPLISGIPQASAPQMEMPNNNTVITSSSSSSSSSNAASSSSSATEMSYIKGYEDVKVGENNVILAPTITPQAEKTERKSVGDAASLTIDEALEAMEEHARSACCLRGGVTKELNVVRMDSASAVHIIFESFTEGRSTTTASVPHRVGQPVDGPQNGIAPRPWDIVASPSTLFKNERRSIEVPHTSTVTDCDRCFRRGTISCKECGGQGSNNCHRCHSSGYITVTSHHHDHHSHHHHKHDSSHHHHHHSHGGHHSHRERCHSCGGTGRKQCHRCHGKGFVTCPTCEGTGYLRSYIRLDIQWKLYKSERVLDQTALPNNLIRDAGGITMFHEEDFAIRPLSHLPRTDVNQAANELVAAQKIPNVERLLRQKMNIRIVPIFEVHYTYKGSEQRRFWVYGTERKVYQDNYPSWCCSLS